MARLTFVVIFLTSSRLRQSSNHLFPIFFPLFKTWTNTTSNKQRTILQLLWTMDVDNCLYGANKLYNFSLRNRFIVYPHSIYSATVQLSRLLFASILQRCSEPSCDRKRFYLSRVETKKNKLVKSNRQNVALNHSSKGSRRTNLISRYPSTDMWKLLFASSLVLRQQQMANVISTLESFGPDTAVGWEHKR